MPRFLITRTVDNIEAATVDEALRIAIGRDAFYNVAEDVAWGTVDATAAEKKRGHYYPVIIAESIESAPWIRKTNKTNAR